MIFYLTNVTNAVILSQPSACIEGGLHAPSFRTALSKPRNLSYSPLKIRSRPKKGENRPRPRTESLDSWVSKAARLREDTTQKATEKFLLAAASTFPSYDPPKTTSPRLLGGQDSSQGCVCVGSAHSLYTGVPYIRSYSSPCRYPKRVLAPRRPSG